VADSHAFLVNLALVLCVAAVTTVVFQRLRQPVVLGYLLAGAIVGPHTHVPLFADASIVHTLSELGVILLMFSLGLEFSLRKLVRIGPTAGVVAVIQSSLMLWLGYVSARAFGGQEQLRADDLLAVAGTHEAVEAARHLLAAGEPAAS
jgi:CPA2 family monovalent cation:H+ antiporter-2